MTGPNIIEQLQANQNALFAQEEHTAQCAMAAFNPDMLVENGSGSLNVLAKKLKQELKDRGLQDAKAPDDLPPDLQAMYNRIKDRAIEHGGIYAEKIWKQMNPASFDELLDSILKPYGPPNWYETKGQQELRKQQEGKNH